jgi:transcriptional regulator with XRE-family HTH domain
MVARDPNARPDLRALAPPTLKGLRRLRGVGPLEMANALGISRRALENFENGKGRINVDRIHRVAARLGADPYAIQAAFEIGSPDFALRCANNKFMMIFMLALEDFDAQAQDMIVGLDPLDLMKAFKAFFDSLILKAQEQDGVVRQWRADKAARDAEGEADDAPDPSGTAPEDPSGPEDPEDR